MITHCPVTELEVHYPHYKIVNTFFFFLRGEEWGASHAIAGSPWFKTEKHLCIIDVLICANAPVFVK